MNNNVAQKLYDLLGTKFDNTTIKTLNSKGKETTDMEEIEMFSFDFVAEKRNYGAVVILLSAKDNLEVYYGDNTSKTLDSAARKKWENLIEHLSTFARANRLGFSLKHTTDLKYDLSNIADITESYKNIFEGYYGTSKTSYNPQGKAKIIIKHSKAIGEDDARFRNINALFIENSEGERFKLPFKKLAGARAMARHVTEGGNPYDLFGLHISEMVKDINTLGSFVRRSKMYEGNDDAANLIEAGRTHYNNLRKNLKTISGVRGYQNYKESWEPASITEQDLDTDKIRSLFLEKSVSSRVEAALPLLAQLYELAEENNEEVINELDDPNTITYKEFKIEVKPWKKGFAATARNRAKKKVAVAPGKTEDEAIAAVQAELDKFIGQQKKVSGAASVNLNAQFAATHLRAGETEIWGKLIPGPKLVIAGDEALEMGPEFLKSEGFTKTGRRNRPGSEGIDLLGFKLNPARAQASKAIANGRYIITDYAEDKDGNKVYGLEFDSVVSSTEEKFTFDEPALTVATARQYESIGEEVKMKEITEFENWANKMVGEDDEVTEGTWSLPDTPKAINALKQYMSKEQPIGIDAINASDVLADIIGDDDLFDELEDMAKKDPDADGRPIVKKFIELMYHERSGYNKADEMAITRMYQAIQNAGAMGEGLNCELDADDENQLNASANKDLDNYIKKEAVGDQRIGTIEVGDKVIPRYDSTPAHDQEPLTVMSINGDHAYVKDDWGNEGSIALADLHRAPMREGDIIDGEEMKYDPKSGKFTSKPYEPEEDSAAYDHVRDRYDHIKKQKADPNRDVPDSVVAAARKDKEQFKVKESQKEREELHKDGDLVLDKWYGTDGSESFLIIDAVTGNVIDDYTNYEQAKQKFDSLTAHDPMANPANWEPGEEYGEVIPPEPKPGTQEFRDKVRQDYKDAKEREAMESVNESADFNALMELTNRILKG